MTAPVGDFELPTFVPQPTPVNNNAHAPEVRPQKEDEETHVHHQYNLQLRPNLVNVAVFPVHSQPPKVHPRLTSTTISPNITRLRSRVAIRNYDIHLSIIPIIKVKIPQLKYAQGYDAANHALQLWQLQTKMHTNFPNEGFARAIIDDETRKSLEFRHLIKIDKYRDIWMKSFANELGRLAQGICDITGTDTIDFIPHAEVIFRTTVTYRRIVYTYRPHKTENHRTRLTVGGNLFICLNDVSSPTSDTTTAKLLFKSGIYTPGARFITLDF